MPRVMTDRGQALLEMYPEFLRGDQTLQALCNAAGPEFDLLDIQLERLERNLTPSTSDDFLDFYEQMLKLTVHPVMPVDQRRSIVLAFLARMTINGSTADWYTQAQKVLGTGFSYRVHDPTDGTSPPADNIVVTIPFVAGSNQAAIAQALLQSIVPATVIMNVTYGEGFILDVSLLDDDLL